MTRVEVRYGGAAPSGDAQADARDREAEALASRGLRVPGVSLLVGCPTGARGGTPEPGFVTAGPVVVLHGLDDPSGDPRIHGWPPGVAIGFLVTIKSITLVSSPVKSNDW
ncbi:MAG: hypothetical protein ACXWA9_01325 [Acidimicrobiia bacterium]